MIKNTLMSAAILATGTALSASAEDGTFPPGIVPENPENGGYRYFEVSLAEGALNMRADRSTAAAVVARLESGMLLANLGCSAVDIRAWCDVQSVMGGPRGYVVADFLQPAVGADGTAPRGPETSAQRAGQGDFDATGQIPCALTSEQPMGQCNFGVARSGGGDATIVLTRPDGRKRAIFYSLGRPISADTSQADNGAFRSARSGDLWTIKVGDERYQIPDAAILGG